jgi:hypothetical protein
MSFPSFGNIGICNYYYLQKENKTQGLRKKQLSKKPQEKLHWSTADRAKQQAEPQSLSTNQCSAKWDKVFLNLNMMNKSAGWIINKKYE